LYKSRTKTNRYNGYAAYLKRLFGGRIQKLSVDAGFSCPNRDGTKGTGGCTYCNNKAFNPSYCDPSKPLEQQITQGIEFHRRRYSRAGGYFVYFQPFSNTYKQVDELESLFRKALAFPGIEGIVVATRPDCIDELKLDMLASLAKNHTVIVEFGIESFYDRTLQRINRGHTAAESVRAIKAAASRGLPVGTHLIFGLPGESRQDMLDEAQMLSSLPVASVKFHQLQIIRDTAMEQEYREHPEYFSFFSLDDYIDFIVEFTTHLSPSIAIERIAGEVPPRFLAGPSFGLLRNDQLLEMFKKRLEENDAWQGKFFTASI